MCLFKKLKFLKPDDKKKTKKDISKKKRIKKTFKIRRRKARRRRRARKRLNKMKKLKFDEETLANVKHSVLLVLQESEINTKTKSKKFRSFKSNSKFNSKNKAKSNKDPHLTSNINIIGSIREIRTPLLGKRSNSIKSIDTTDGETDSDGLSGKGKSSSCSWLKKGNKSCCHNGWQSGHGSKKELYGINNYKLYDIYPVKDEGLLQEKLGKGISAQNIYKSNKCKNISIYNF